MKSSLRYVLNRASLTGSLALGLVASSPLIAAETPVSWWRDVTPIFKRSCNGCHNPNKLKGEVDTSTFVGLMKPGKHGQNLIAGDPAKSLLISSITGQEPDMPKEGDALSPQEVALITRWIQEGAKDDTPADAYSTRLKEPPTYAQPPVISALDVSPDGTRLAVAGYHEVLLIDTASWALASRLLGESPRIESVAFSPDGRSLAVSGGAPARFGEIQIWNVPAARQIRGLRTTTDSLFGISWSPDGTRVATGGADKSVRVTRISDGQELVKFENHGDWVFRTTWVAGGTRLLSASRDRAMKLIDATNGQFIDDVNKLLEPIDCMVRHPREDWAAYGGAEGGLRLYKAKENQDRTSGNNDVNLVREFERQPGPVQSIAFSPDGTLLATGNTGTEVRVYETATGKRRSTLPGHAGSVFALKFSPDGQRLYTAGFEGIIRVFNPASGSLQAIFYPVPLTPVRQTAQN
jgi:WD40 repeat protein